MNHIERNTLIRECNRQYYNKDKKVFIDESCMQITCIVYYIYNLFFFGNKIILSNRFIKNIKKFSKLTPKNENETIRKRNSIYILQAIEKDQNLGKKNFEIVSLEEYGKEKAEQVYQFLIKNRDGIICTAESKLAENLKERGIDDKRIEFLQKGMKEVRPFVSRKNKFETIGALQFDKGKMYIKKRENPIIKVYNHAGIEKKGEIVEVKPYDIVLIRGKKTDKITTINLYRIVSFHTKNQALRIIWTDLIDGQKSNEYIEELPEYFRRMIIN